EGEPPIGPRIFVPAAFDEQGREARRQSLRSTEIAQKALGAASLAALGLVKAFGLRPSATAGHSFGELSALHAAGFLSASSYASLSVARGRLMGEAVQAGEPGGMLAFAAGPDSILPLIEGVDGVTIANFNGPMQTVVSGPQRELDQVKERARTSGIRGIALSVAGAFHSAALESVKERLRGLVGEGLTGPPTAPVYSNTSASLYPADARLVAEQVAEQVRRPVRFAEMIEAMYDDGLRTFLEVGPGSILSSLVGSILGDRPHRALAIEPTGRPGLLGWLSTLGVLFVSGHEPNLERLFRGRSLRRLDPKSWSVREPEEPLSASTWLVNGARARLRGESPPQILGASIDPLAKPAARGARPNRANPAPFRVASLRPDAPASPASPLPRPHRRDDAATEVVQAFQETMRSFLETQRDAMLGYLRGVPGASRVSTPSQEWPATAPEPRMEARETGPDPSIS
ncbi:MAG TPA: acyltransferase domain-containing protein, partial [Isosphaeraceae bacterium]|nr:acyltransferase domain-containing protein [Isosphaeraceae bacterium]